MDILLVPGPETPDPTQLDLFDMDVKNAGTVQNSTDSAELSMSDRIMIRSPTTACSERVQQEDGKKFELAPIQKIIAGSLYEKSRELVKKSRETKQQELTETT